MEAAIRRQGRNRVDAKLGSRMAAKEIQPTSFDHTPVLGCDQKVLVEDSGRDAFGARSSWTCKAKKKAEPYSKAWPGNLPKGTAYVSTYHANRFGAIL